MPLQTSELTEIFEIQSIKGKKLSKEFAAQGKSRNFAPLFHSAAVGMQSSPLSWVGTDNNTFNYPSKKWQI